MVSAYRSGELSDQNSLFTEKHSEEAVTAATRRPPDSRVLNTGDGERLAHLNFFNLKSSFGFSDLFRPITGRLKCGLAVEACCTPYAG